MQATGIAPDFGRRVFAGRCQRIHRKMPGAVLERHFQRLDHARTFHLVDAEAVGHHVEHLAPAFRALGLNAREAGGGQPLLDFFRRCAGGQFDRECHDQARCFRSRRPLCTLRQRSSHVGTLCGNGVGMLHLGGVYALRRLHTCTIDHPTPPQQIRINRIRIVLPHRQPRHLVIQPRKACEEQLQVIVQLRHGADGRARGAHRVGLVDRNRRRHAFHLVHGGLVHAVQKLACVGAEGFHIAPLALRI